MFDISLELPCGPENWPSVPLAIAFSQLLDVWKITPNSLLLYQTNGSYSGWCHLEHACHHFCFSCADSPRHNGMTYTLWLYSGAHCTQKQYTLTRNCTWTFEFGSGPELALFSMVLSQNAGQWAAAPGQPQGHEVNHRYSHNHSVPRQLLWLSLSIQYSVNYTR